jgi:transposase-like protein
MSYVRLDAATKMTAVKQYWRTRSLKKCAEEFGVSRNALYAWVRLAEENLERIFEASRPGKRTATLAEQNQKLQAQLDDVLDAYHKISHPPPSLPAALARCSRCHATSLLRNGRVRTKRHGLRQRLWCRKCDVSVYVDVKKTL